MKIFLQLGPIPQPPPTEIQMPAIVGHVLFGAYVMLVAITTLLWCSERFRELLARLLCHWMERHASEIDAPEERSRR